MKRGDTFTHAHWLDAEHKPLQCVVTRVAQGVVYWKTPDEKKARHYFPLDQASKYVRPTDHPACTAAAPAHPAHN